MKDHVVEEEERKAQFLRAIKAYWARKYEFEAPSGTRDSSGLWLPIASERQPCCEKYLQQPIPLNNRDLLFNHCCSAEHVANLYHVKVKDILSQLW